MISIGGSRAAATSKMERFVITVNGFEALTFIKKHSILDVAAALDPPLDLTIWKNIHKVKENQGNFKIEDKWFERVTTNVRTPSSSLVISDIILKWFKDLIQQDREIFTVDNQVSPRFLYSDLCLLVGQLC